MATRSPENFLGVMAPQPLPNGARGWAVPMDPALRVIHAGDVTEVGRVVAGAFGAGDRLPNGSTLAVCGGTYSWNDFASTLNAFGHRVQAVQVPAEVYEAHISAATALVRGRSSFAAWAAANVRP